MRIRWLGILLALTISMPVFSADPAQKLYLSASKAERDGETAKALSLYEKIVNRHPDSPLAIKASDKLTEKMEADRLAVKNLVAAKEKEQDAARIAEHQERQEAETKMQQWAQQCMNQKNQCKQACVTRYGGHSDYQMTTCQIDCNSRRDCNPYAGGRADCFKRGADKMSPACWGT